MCKSSIMFWAFAACLCLSYMAGSEMTERGAKSRFGGKCCFTELLCLCVCLYLAHVNNVFALSQRILGFVDASMGRHDRVCLFVCVCAVEFVGPHDARVGWFAQGVCVELRTVRGRRCRQSSPSTQPMKDGWKCKMAAQGGTDGKFCQGKEQAAWSCHSGCSW